MPRCQGTTTKGRRCKRPAMEGSDYCSIHEPEGASGSGSTRTEGRAEEDALKTIFGFAFAGAVILWALSRWR